jgi:hypothetical protein
MSNYFLSSSDGGNLFRSMRSTCSAARSNRPPTVPIEFLWTRPLLAPRAVWHPLLSRYSSDREDMERPLCQWSQSSDDVRAYLLAASVA